MATPESWDKVWSGMKSNEPIRWKSGEAFQDWLFQYTTLDQETPVFSGDGQVRVLVPLAGDSPFVHHAAQQGHNVVAVEWSKIACELLEQKSKDLGVSSKVTILQKDIFDALDELQQSSCAFNLIYDKDAFGCLLPEQRLPYVQKMAQVLAPGGFYYLEGKHREEASAGPPFHLSGSDVAKVFGAEFTIVKDEFVLPYEVHPTMKQVAWILKRN